MVGSFTGLQLNINKTIAFCPSVGKSCFVAGIEVGSCPVKYLGAYLGMGDLSKLNFERPLQNARSKLKKWGAQNLTLQAKVLVLKTFVFSLFTHMLNVVYISQEQLETIHKILNDFLWGGWNQIKHSVACSDVCKGGLNMINIKNTVHVLWLKWMDRLCKDVGSSWSHFV